MRILGIDPGYATTGFGILQAERASVQLINYGTITTPTTLSFPERLEMLYDDRATILTASVWNIPRCSRTSLPAATTASSRPST